MIGQRITALRKRLKITQAEMAKLLDCRQPTVHDYEKGRIKPSIQAMQIIASTYKVNLNWLLTGEGEMFLPDALQEPMKYADLEKMVEKKVTNLMKSEMSLYSNPIPIVTDVSDFWNFRIRGEIACGEPMPFVEDDSERIISISKKSISNPNDCDVLRVNGDSMSPDIEHSDLVVIRKESSWDACNNKIVAVRTDDGLTLKKLAYGRGFATLIPSNKNYPLIIADENCHLCGYLIYLVRSFK